MNEEDIDRGSQRPTVIINIHIDSNSPNESQQPDFYQSENVPSTENRFSQRLESGPLIKARGSLPRGIVTRPSTAQQTTIPVQIRPKPPTPTRLEEPTCNRCGIQVCSVVDIFTCIIVCIYIIYLFLFYSLPLLLTSLSRILVSLCCMMCTGDANKKGPTSFIKCSMYFRITVVIIDIFLGSIIIVMSVFMISLESGEGKFDIFEWRKGNKYFVMGLIAIVNSIIGLSTHCCYSRDARSRIMRSEGTAM